jgi:hypothetical protein
MKQAIKTFLLALAITITMFTAVFCLVASPQLKEAVIELITK